MDRAARLAALERESAERLAEAELQAAFDLERGRG
jgi:hypothetical protein